MIDLDAGAEFAQRTRMEGPIAGQAFTKGLKAMPMDRPAQETDTREFLDKFMNLLSNPNQSRQVLGLLEAGVPVDTLSATLLESFVAEGVTNPQVAMVATASVVTVLARMADSAGLEVVLTTDEQVDIPSEAEEIIAKFKEEKKASGKAARAAELSAKDLPEMAEKKSGFMDIKGLV